MTDENDTLGLDILKGVPKIAHFTGEPKRRVYYLLEHKLIPAGKLGAIWIASKTKLREHYARIASGGAV